MRQNLLQIDISNSKSDTDEDLIKIQFRDEDVVQVNFSELVSKSKYIRDKYKYSEALVSIPNEIENIKAKYNINDEIIKHFIKLIQNEKVNIPTEYYKAFYALSEYFIIQKITAELDKIIKNMLFNDLNFTLHILFDSETTTNNFEKKLTSKAENFLSDRINECIENEKFKKLPIPTICRILDKSKEKVNHDLLLDFILESLKTRFILFKYIELHKMTKEKVEEFIKFIDELDEESRKTYLEYIPFNFLFIKNITNNNTNYINEVNQTKEELEQMKRELEKVKNEMKQYPQNIIVGGYDEYNQLGEKPNNKDKDGDPIIASPAVLSFDPSSIHSYTIYGSHSVIVASDDSLKGIGNNKNGSIASSLQKSVINHFTDFCIKDSNGHKLDPVSAVCSAFGTLYMFAKKSGNSGRQLVFCDRDINGGDPVFLDIGNHDPVALFGGCSHFASICSEIIFINRNSVKNSPETQIEAISLPDREKASSVACCEGSVIVLSSKGRVFESSIEKGSCVLRFSEVKELVDKKIVYVSSNYKHFLAVSEEGHVFGCGSNEHGKMGLGKEIESVSSFTVISSLEEYKIKAAYAGGHHSLFQTREGKILSCGWNVSGQLLLTSGPGENVYSPAETMINGGSSFCIAGYSVSAVFIGRDPPPSTPNMRIQQNQ